MNKNFGDTPAAAWYGDVLNNALREGSAQTSWVDMHLLTGMCRAEPKCAQITMQLLAHELKMNLAGAPVSGAPGEAQTTRLLIGAIFLAYCASRDAEDSTPPELEFILNMYPIITECADFVAADQVRYHERQKARGRRPWWRFWSKG